MNTYFNNPKPNKMKKFYLIGLTLVIACFSFVGCQVYDNEPTDADGVSMFSTAATVDAAAGTYSLTISSTRDWTAVPDGWITLDATSGPRGVQAVHLSYGANNTGDARVGKVVFTAGTYSETFTLTQKKAE